MSAKTRSLLVLAVTTFVLVPLALVAVTAVVTSSTPAYACTSGPATPSASLPGATPAATSTPPAWPAEGSWDSAQVGNAAVIVDVGAQLNVPSFGWVIAVATAMQESSLRNLPGGDRDSLGLFQQRPSQGWGSPEQILDPRYAATKFYEKLVRVPGWQGMSLTAAAQAVQISAFPDAYAKWQSDAQRLVDLITARLGITCTVGADGPWQLPLPKGSYAFVSPYGMRWGRMHRGVDLAAPTGTPILAAAAGTVTSAECTSPYCDRPGSPNTPGCGLTVEIDHGGGVGTTYCHASSLSVRAGDRVTAGQQIGRVGSTGHSSGPHLHFQVHQPAPPISNATTIDPVPYMRGVGVDLQGTG
ncbi:M23 family metallopeptidase [Micromonospora gifhornensis]|uniref:M23 family metallopeptidase n=1 Tax=Micromonospora gifhornensis TaxID=84594 RepID=UPI00364AF12B